MPIDSRTGPIHISPLTSKAYRDSYDRIFGTKGKLTGNKPEAKPKAKPLAVVEKPKAKKATKKKTDTPKA